LLGDGIGNAQVDAPFGPPQLVAELATATDEDDPTLTDDMLELYYDDATLGLMRSTRASVTEPWSAPSPVAELNAGGNVNNAKVTGDGLGIYFASSRAPAMGFDFFVATRPNRTSTFTVPQLIVSLQGPMNEIEPDPVSGGLVLYFDRENVGLLRAERASTTTDTFANLQSQTTIDSTAYDGGLFVTANELVVYFHSDRVTAAERAIYRSVRANASDPFGMPVKLAELDMPGKEEDAWLSPDGHTLIFSSNTSGQYDIYMATR
jgi:hypothetical protein